jgi:hypothetical protein
MGCGDGQALRFSKGAPDSLLAMQRVKRQLTQRGSELQQPAARKFHGLVFVIG